jgi:hypothetical protein
MKTKPWRICSIIRKHKQKKQQKIEEKKEKENEIHELKKLIYKINEEKETEPERTKREVDRFRRARPFCSRLLKCR